MCVIVRDKQKRPKGTLSSPPILLILLRNFTRVSGTLPDRLISLRSRRTALA